MKTGKSRKLKRNASKWRYLFTVKAFRDAFCGIIFSQKKCKLRKTRRYKGSEEWAVLKRNVNSLEPRILYQKMNPYP